MATRTIRLTESELTSLIKRIVEDTENDMDNSDDKMTKKEAIEKIADFLDSELTKRQKEKLEDKINDKTTLLCCRITTSQLRIKWIDSILGGHL